MQIVFVHGVSTRDLGDGGYQKWVEDRKDRLNRMAFGGRAQIDNPYWGKFGLGVRTLKSMPSAKGSAEPFVVAKENPEGPVAERRFRSVGGPDPLVMQARTDFTEAVASMSVAAIADATANLSAEERHRVEDFWLAAADYADSRPAPDWLAGVTSTGQLMEELARHSARSGNLEAVPRQRQHRGAGRAGWQNLDPNAFIAGKARDVMAGYLAQFLGDALMFFSRRERSGLVREEICRSVVRAAGLAHANDEPLVLIGYSMGGGVLHEILTDPVAVERMQSELGRPLEIDLFLSVGTQIGMFAELNQFANAPKGQPLAVPAVNYWNVFDYNDTLSFLCSPVIEGAVDLEVSTGANVKDAHGAYFESALFYSRLNRRLRDAGLV